MTPGLKFFFFCVAFIAFGVHAFDAVVGPKRTRAIAGVILFGAVLYWMFCNWRVR